MWAHTTKFESFVVLSPPRTPETMHFNSPCITASKLSLKNLSLQRMPGVLRRSEVTSHILVAAAVILTTAGIRVLNESAMDFINSFMDLASKLSGKARN